MILSAVGWAVGTVVAVALTFVVPVDDPLPGCVLGMVCALVGGMIGWAVDRCLR